ncbi:hypothetical protein cyc_00957 [Cyclospora cayetanensis]|uniref:DUF4149 domain-containing protein n=1 Tax=Cyclospora cayetanensis TaxID=88456 RepID=A0A1D3D971_9EIME|nr:hypothetical protein cyc_00957 [Cyclospora cayetanensis]
MPCCLSKLPFLAAGAGVASLLLSIPASLSGSQSLLQQTDNHPLAFLGMTALLNCSFGALFGSSFWSEHFPLFSCVSTVFSSFLLLTTCELALDHRRLQAVVCANLLLNLANSCYIFPKQVCILKRREELADNLGVKPDEPVAVVVAAAEKAAATEGPLAASGQELLVLQKSFRRLHALGMVSSALTFGCLIPFIFS